MSVRKAQHLFLQSMLSFLLVCLPSSGISQTTEEDSKKMEQLLEDHTIGQETTAAPVKKKNIPYTNLEPINIEVQWRLWQTLISEGKSGDAAIKVLREQATSLGHENMPAMSMASISMIKKLHSEGTLKTQDAINALAPLATLAPDSPYPFLAHARFIVRHKPTMLPQAIVSFISGLQKTVSWPDAGIPWRFNLTLYALLAVLGSGLITISALMMRHFGIVTYDSLRILPRGFSSAQATIMMLALIIIPGILMQSLLLSTFLLLITITCTQQIRERIATIILFGVLAALPSIEQYLSQQLTWSSSQTRTLLQAQYEYCNEVCLKQLATRQSLQQEVAPHKSRAILEYTLMLGLYRAGKINRVLRDFSPKVISSWPKIIAAYGANVYGAALLAKAKPEEAITILKKARSDLKKTAVPSVNLMRAHQMLDHKDEANISFDDANKRQQKRVLAHLNLKNRDINSLLWVEPLPLKFFAIHHQRNDPPKLEIISRFWPYIAGLMMPFEFSTPMGLLGLFVVIVTTPLAFGRVSTSCPSCGLARDPQDGKETANHAFCKTCHDTFIMGSTLSYETRIANEDKLAAKRNLLSLIRRLLSLLAPGSGHTFSGYGCFGLLLLSTLLFGVILLLRPTGIWRPPQEIVYSSWFQLEYIGMLLISIPALVGLHAAIRDIRPAHIRTKDHEKERLKAHRKQNPEHDPTAPHTHS